MRSICLAYLVATLWMFFPTSAGAAGPSYEYKIVKSKRVNLVGMNLGRSREMGLEEVEALMKATARDGWRLASTSLVQEDKYGGYSFLMFFERQIGGAPVLVAAPVADPGVPQAPTPTPTPRPTRTPRPPPTNDPCVAGTPCIVETFLGSELTVEIGKEYNVNLRSGDTLHGTVTAARRLEVVLDTGAKGSRTLKSAEISNMTDR